jgi:hypothetical protein
MRFLAPFPLFAPVNVFLFVFFGNTPRYGPLMKKPYCRIARGSGQLGKILPARTSQHAARTSSTLEPEIRRLPGLEVKITFVASVGRMRT